MKRSLSIRSQMVVFFSLLLVIPVVVAMIYVYVMMQANFQKTYADHQRQTTEALSLELAKWRAAYEDLSLQIFGDTLVQRTLGVEEWQLTAHHMALRGDMRNKLVYYSQHSSYVSGVYVMDNRQQVIGTPELRSGWTAYMRDNAERVAGAGGRPVWDSGWNSQTFVLWRRINDTTTDLNRHIGYLAVMIDRSELRRSLRQLTLDAGQQFRVSDGAFFELTTGESENSLFFADEQGQARVGHHLVNAGQSDFVYYGVKRDGWLLSTWIPREQRDKPFNSLKMALLFITAAVLTYLIIMIVFMSSRITRPLRMIYETMKRVVNGFLELRVPVLRNDEIGQVARTLNRMSGQIAILIEKHRLEERKRRIIQLRTMEYQINPHFLYNTLDSVNMLARKYDDQRIGDIVTSLSRLFRLGLNQGGELVTVAQELEHAGYYLHIQGIRFGDQLVSEIGSQPEVNHMRMIKFVLQPLIENSIIHGIRSRRRPGRVAVNAWAERDHIVLEVADDGVGMDAERLAAVRASLDRELTDEPERHTQGSGFGLWNVHQRIKLRYGSEYGLDLVSGDQAGTTVRVRLPALTEEEER